ncbi:MAG: S41 family peptidase [Bacteroidales bacterium]
MKLKKFFTFMILSVMVFYTSTEFSFANTRTHAINYYKAKDFSTKVDLSKEARLLRFPAVGGNKIIFTYAGDLYSVDINGGQAERLTSDIGYEMFARISPDGKTIAFTGQYDGNTEVYTIPITGGTPHRVTYSATVERDQVGERMGPNNIVMCWTPEGKIVYRSKQYNFSGLRGVLFTINPDGSDNTEIPTSEGGFCSFSPDGQYLALNRMFREFRTWKYYRGGQADDIWINKVGTTELEDITNNDAQDIFPMWINNKIYFFSDRDMTMNLFCYDRASKLTTKVTNFTDYDNKFPSYSQDYVVFENGGYIYKYSVKDNKTTKVNISLISDNVYGRDKYLGDLKSKDLDLSPDGKRVIGTFRGQVLSIPATKGVVYNLSNTQGAHARDVMWSPDGNYIAYFSDLNGEYQVCINDLSDKYNTKILTNFKNGYPQDLSWSPDSKKIYFQDEKNNFYQVSVPSGKLHKLFNKIMNGYEVSPDCNYIAYTAQADNEANCVYIYDIKNNKHYQASTSWYDSYTPVFSEDGKYLFYSSGREFLPRYSRVEWNASFSVNSSIFAIPLNKDVKDPVLIEGDEYVAKVAAKEGKDDKSKVNAKDNGDKTPMIIDFNTLIERTVALDVPAGNHYLTGCYNHALYYYTRGGMKKIDLNTFKSSPVKADIRAISGNKKFCIIHKDDKYYVAPTNSFKTSEPVPMENISLIVDYHKEWAQIYNETWRIYRDYFYVKTMHGQNWDKIHDKYAALLPYVNNRHDLTYLIGEMIGELCSGHSYVTTGQAVRPERLKTGLFGAKFTKEGDAFKITHIFKGEDWNEAAKSPLYEQRDNVKEGDYIVEINGVSTKGLNSIYQATVGKANEICVLKVNSEPKLAGAKTIYVKTIADESKLAYYEWVHNNIAKVDKMSNGEIGYIHIPDMGVAGLTEFTKLFYKQLKKKALIIDDRMNGGGNVSPMIIERLLRHVYSMTMSRYGKEETVPGAAHHGPKVCLVDKYSSSDGDLFPYRFQKLKIGEIIGMRTWGGIIGISGSKPYIDGQDVRTPFFTNYSTEGKWIIENHGVDPDIVVDINPFEDYKGNDAQLNKAVEVLKVKLKNYKPLPHQPKVPRDMIHRNK